MSHERVVPRQRRVELVGAAVMLPRVDLPAGTDAHEQSVGPSDEAAVDEDVGVQQEGGKPAGARRGEGEVRQLGLRRRRRPGRRVVERPAAQRRPGPRAGGEFRPQAVPGRGATSQCPQHQRPDRRSCIARAASTTARAGSAMRTPACHVDQAGARFVGRTRTCEVLSRRRPAGTRTGTAPLS